jgi:hypothetical protein
MPFDKVARLDAAERPPGYDTRGGKGYRDQLRALMLGDDGPAAEDQGDVNTPGSPAYLERRGRDYREDLRRSPRK